MTPPHPQAPEPGAPKPKRRRVMEAELSPDVYAGEACNQIRHRWMHWTEGDKDGPDEMAGSLALDPKCFPPGTKVIVEEPICPKCAEPRYCDLETGDWPKLCEGLDGTCGFDWDQWTRETYS